MIISTSGLHEAQPGSWFVIWTESRAEKKVEARVSALGLSTWLPTVKERRRWSDRWQEVVSPLFPGYLFARVGAVPWHRVLCTPGVLTIVKRGEEPALLPAEFVSRLRFAIEEQGAQPKAADAGDFVSGDEVIVQEGALQGLRGIVKQRRSRRQPVIWIAEIGRGVSVSIGSALVRAA